MAVVDRVITSAESGDPVTDNVRITLAGRDGRWFVDAGALVPAEPRG